MKFITYNLQFIDCEWITNLEKVQKKSWKLVIRLKMKNYNMMLTEKHQKYLLLSGIIDKFEYLTGNKMLPSNQSQIIDILSLLILL